MTYLTIITGLTDNPNNQTRPLRICNVIWFKGLHHVKI